MAPSVIARPFRYDDFTHIKVDFLTDDPRIAVLTLNRPEKLNAWTDVNGMSQSIVRAFNQFDKDDTVKVIVVTGAGRAFCAGADLSAGGATFGDANATENPGSARNIRNARDGGGQAALAISRCRKVVIGAINGPAVGIGITFTLPMDFRIAYKGAKIGFVFVRRGIVPEATSTYHLPRLIGHSRTLSLMLTGEVFPASHPLLSLLFYQLTDTPEACVAAALDLARNLAKKNSTVSMALAKHLVWKGTATPEEQHLLDSKAMYTTGNSVDSAEGVQSFLEKREVNFKGGVVKDIDNNPVYSGWYPWWGRVSTEGVPNLTEPLHKL
ncbi:ClpP/crotonase [Gonapodya prolifera JEL478]|uniref:ClpP/crotonase n=1 Tax=Gonapodya prolifera (strain JEL478) TaxID=1344416 RepID=A0A139ARX6_GONPJ|nr:ClpP/crotonase [Gonapodya prolifera JEL478]|eukprot:KXS19482.1 ClpP/crotonase [Gonapodya prolifera JEL478]